MVQIEQIASDYPSGASRPSGQVNEQCQHERTVEACAHENISNKTEVTNKGDLKTSDSFLYGLRAFYTNIEARQFEEILIKLEEVTNYLQSKNLPLDEAIECYRISKLISNVCESKLQNAKLRIHDIDATIYNEGVGPINVAECPPTYNNSNI